MFSKKLLHSCIVLICVTQALMFSRLDATKIIPGAAYFIVHTKNWCIKRILGYSFKHKSGECPLVNIITHDFPAIPHTAFHQITFHDESGKCIHHDTKVVSPDSIYNSDDELYDYCGRRLDPEVKPKIKAIRAEAEETTHLVGEKVKHGSIIRFYDNDNYTFEVECDTEYHEDITLDTLERFKDRIDISKIAQIEPTFFDRTRQILDCTLGRLSKCTIS